MKTEIADLGPLTSPCLLIHPPLIPPFVLFHLALVHGMYSATPDIRTWLQEPQES